MKPIAPTRISVRACAMAALGACALAAMAGLAFAGWMEHAPAILTTLAQQGLAWCF